MAGRIENTFGDELLADAGSWGSAVAPRSSKAALELLHRKAAEERMARSVRDFYDGATVPLPIGVRSRAHDHVPDDEDTLHVDRAEVDQRNLG